MLDENMTQQQMWYQMGQECQCANELGKTKRAMTIVLGEKYGYSQASIHHYEKFYRCVEHIEEKVAGTRTLLLDGQIPLSVEKIEYLAKRTAEEIESAITRFINKVPFQVVFPDFRHRASRARQRNKTTVKDTPKYDPDAQVMGVIHTIPSWIDALNRVNNSADFGCITVNTHRRLKSALESLKILTETTLTIIMEEES